MMTGDARKSLTSRSRKKTEDVKTKEIQEQQESDPAEKDDKTKNEEAQRNSDGDKKKEEGTAKKSTEKKKKGEAEKKKVEREKQQQRDEEQRKTLEALEQQQQHKQALQRQKEEEEKHQQRQLQQQQQIQMQQQYIQQQQQQQHLKQLQQQQLKQQQQQDQFIQIQQQQKLQQQQQQMLEKQMQQKASLQQESRRQQLASEGPSWNVPTSSSAPSLAEIQRMEEERQMRIREKIQQLQVHEQRIQQQQRAAAGWGDKNHGGPPVASLRQIQEEEARKLLARQRNHHQQQQQQQQQQAKISQTMINNSAWNAKGQQQQQPPNYGGYDTSSTPSFWDDVMTRAPSMETSNNYPRGTAKARPASDPAFPSLSSGSTKQNKRSKEEDLVRRLFQQTNSHDEFIQWINKNLPSIGKTVDVPTFVHFLSDIESHYEVHEYVRSYIGDSPDGQRFAREFLEWRQNNSKSQNAFLATVSSSGMVPMSTGGDPASPDGDDPSGRRKKSKKKMQKVNPSLLGFSCNANPSLLNRGEIQSATDAWNMK